MASFMFRDNALSNKEFLLSLLSNRKYKAFLRSLSCAVALLLMLPCVHNFSFHITETGSTTRHVFAQSATTVSRK